MDDYMDDYAETQEAMDAAADRAKAQGLTVIYGEPNNLLLDLDDGAPFKTELLTKLQNEFGEYTLDGWRSRGKKGRHVVITFEKASFTAAEAIALEATLGSDPLRAILGIKRLQNGVQQPRMLFKP